MGKRFKMEIDDDMTGEDFVAEVAEMACSSDLERAGGVSCTHSLTRSLLFTRSCSRLFPSLVVMCVMRTVETLGGERLETDEARLCTSTPCECGEERDGS